MSEFVVSPKIYFTIFSCLLVLTALTVAAATVDLGRFNVVVALGIAGVKGSLVLLYFMHLRYSQKLTWLVVAGAFVWLFILIGLTMSDELTRHWLMMAGR